MTEINTENFMVLWRNHNETPDRKEHLEWCVLCQMVPEIVKELDQLKAAEARAYRKGVEDAAKVCDRLRIEERKCSPLHSDHDDRWCPECAAMEDAYGVAEQEIEKLSKHDSTQT